MSCRGGWRTKSWDCLARALYGSAYTYPYVPQHEHWMRHLQQGVVSTLSVGFVGLFSFYRDRDHPHNKVACPDFAAFVADSHMWGYCRQWHNQLLFLCALHRLQQLPSDAVLAQLHSILSRCCWSGSCWLLALLRSTVVLVSPLSPRPMLMIV